MCYNDHKAIIVFSDVPPKKGNKMSSMPRKNIKRKNRIFLALVMLFAERYVKLDHSGGN